MIEERFLPDLGLRQFLAVPGEFRVSGNERSRWKYQPLTFDPQTHKTCFDGGTYKTDAPARAEV
jgi:hypothetical protein